MALSEFTEPTKDGNRPNGAYNQLSPTNDLHNLNTDVFSELVKLPRASNPLSPKFGGSDARINEDAGNLAPGVIAQSRKFEYMNTRLQSRREIKRQADSLKGIGEDEQRNLPTIRFRKREI